MDQATQSRLIERVFQLEERGPDSAIAHESEWPVEYYYDEHRYQRELAMMRRQPVPVAHVSQLREPGDFLTETILGQSVVVVRSHAGDLKAFLNVCRHRGAEVVRESSGSGLKSFVCPYHAWTYDTEGKLAHVPDQRRSFPNLCRDDFGLVELPLEERHGLAWVTVDGRSGEAGSTPVDAFLGEELDAELESYRIADHPLYKTDSWTTAFNWKTGVESFLENYHFAVLHRATAGRVFVHNLGIYDQLNVHFRAVAPKKNLPELRQSEREQWSIRGTATIMYVIFPFSCLFVEKDHFNLLQILPEGVDRCRIKSTHLVRRLSPHLEEYWDGNIEFFLSAVHEDLDICESMQRGYRSAANTTVTFGRNEIGCHNYRRCIEEMLAASPAATPGRGQT